MEITLPGQPYGLQLLCAAINRLGRKTSCSGRPSVCDLQHLAVRGSTASSDLRSVVPVQVAALGLGCAACCCSGCPFPGHTGSGPPFALNIHSDSLRPRVLDVDVFARQNPSTSISCTLISPIPQCFKCILSMLKTHLTEFCLYVNYIKVMSGAFEARDTGFVCLFVFIPFVCCFCLFCVCTRTTRDSECVNQPPNGWLLNRFLGCWAGV